MVPRRLLVDLTFTSARANTSVSSIGARLTLPGSLALGAHYGKLDADLRTSALLGTPSVQSVHDYYPLALEDGGRLAHMAVELVDCMAILAAILRVLGMGDEDSRSLRLDCYARMQYFIRQSTDFPSRRCVGDVRR
jgi:hypothetical protein